MADHQSVFAEKFRRAGENGVAPSLLGFESGGEHWLVDLADAGEVLPVPALSEVFLTKSWFRGIANIRGTLYGVTDLAAFQGGDPTPVRMQSRLLLVGARPGSQSGGNVALLMAGTQGLKTRETMETVSAPAGRGNNQPWRGECYRDKEGRTWTHLLLPVLLGTSEFLNIAV